mmetsp:Transcript_35186/g.53919  ORF Transcript_35186/g.53919 Transcript_35186/m.53919 type:complete len:91 (+) Transcript_35186:327-599(+)|eukprot:CAMPEP_0170508044 /NCGR_PEP_ID=MMETSP0208-20121228/61041_1 /TAXON_ID=197538 /ORGANISM="Strombidium inclinatum, Strain S3" /LENGTH=90 /DNA_ID=CAMNT_0010790679 /DNA_START=321 /DNA_END=593 /DNA_ORIENTATION=+
MTTSEFLTKYGEYLIGILILICAFGVCASAITINGELEVMEPPNPKTYRNHLKSYVEIGNIWDPEEEEIMKQNANSRPRENTAESDSRDN